MFTDAVSNARKEYELMTAAGKKATPVWKQVAASLFSPQTALAALITLTVVYGKEIGEWIKGLFGGKNAMDELRESMRETYEVEKEANATFVKSRFEMDRVIKSVKEFKGSKEEETQKGNRTQPYIRRNVRLLPDIERMVRYAYEKEFRLYRGARTGTEGPEMA